MNKKGSNTPTDIILSLLFVGLFTSVFGLWFADVGGKYEVDYNNSQFEAFNKVDDIVILSEDLKQATESTKEQSNALSGVVDRVGSFFAAGYRVLLLLFTSMGMMGSIISSGIATLFMGAVGAIFNTVLTTTVVILFVVGIIVSILVKWKT